MAEEIRLAIALFGYGFRDSLFGIAAALHVDKVDVTVTEREARRTEGRSTPPSTLQQRREQRLSGRTKEAVVKDKEVRVLHRIVQCCIWNGGLFMLSVLAFYGILLPVLQYILQRILSGTSFMRVWWWMDYVLSVTFHILWVLPLFCLSKVINSFWFQDIADVAYKKARGAPRMLPSVGKIVADILFSLLLQTLFLIQAYLPILFEEHLPLAHLGHVLHMVHTCLLYSLYAFEYKWFNMGWEVHRRLAHVEAYWPYFVGFGLPLTVLTSLFSSVIVSGCIFSVLFPLFIISGNEALPISSSFNTPVRFFAPVIFVTNKLFKQTLQHKSKVNQPPVD